MPQTSPDSAEHWTSYMQDILASDASVRDGLHDEDAIPFMAWGRTQAAHLAAQMAAQPPDVDEEIAGTKAHALVKLMTTISRAVVYRHKQGADWLAKVFARLNQLSQQVYGADAPVLSDATIATWIAQHPQHSDGELLRDLMARYAPPPAPITTPVQDMLEPPDVAPDAPDAPADTPTTPTAPMLPGRTSTPPPSPRDDSAPSDTGDDHEQA